MNNNYFYKFPFPVFLEFQLPVYSYNKTYIGQADRLACGLLELGGSAVLSV